MWFDHVDAYLPYVFEIISYAQGDCRLQQEATAAPLELCVFLCHHCFPLMFAEIKRLQNVYLSSLAFQRRRFLLLSDINIAIIGVEEDDCVVYYLFNAAYEFIRFLKFRLKKTSLFDFHLHVIFTNTLFMPALILIISRSQFLSLSSFNETVKRSRHFFQC